MLEQLEPLTITTDASGDFTGYVKNLRSPGRIVAIKYDFGNLDNTLDLTITGEKTESPILAYTDVPAADAWWYPMAKSNLASTGAASAITEVPVFVLRERIKVVVAQGGNVQTGTITIFVDQE